MTTITIQITIDAGEDARVTVAPPTVQHGPRPAAVDAGFEDELVPLPPEPTTVTAFRGSAHGNSDQDQCPVHHEPWKLVPAGVSKRTGASYDAFKACPVKGCNQRPPARAAS